MFLGQAVGGATLELMALSYASEGKSDADSVGFVGLIAAGVAAVYGASAYYGWNQLATCRLRYETPRRRWITPSIIAASR